MAIEKADRAIDKRVDVGAWGALFVWIGIVLLAHLSWNIGLIGVGAVMLGAQLARRISGIKVEGFWVVVASLFVIGGVWGLLQVQLGLVPILCIVAGLALVVWALAAKPKQLRPRTSG